MAFNLLYGTFYFRVSWSSIVIVYNLCLVYYSVLSLPELWFEMLRQNTSVNSSFLKWSKPTRPSTNKLQAKYIIIGFYHVNVDLLGILLCLLVQRVVGLRGGCNTPVFHKLLVGLYNLFVHTVDIYSELCECPYL